LISDALKMKARSEVEVVGIINNSKQIVTRKGETMQFVQLEDASSLSEVVIFPSAIENVKTVLNDGDVIKVTGSVSKRNGETKIIAEEIVPFSSNYIKIVLAKTSSKELIPKIHSILKENQGDLPVYVDINGKSIQAQSNASKEVVSLISDLLGEEAVFLV
ncbi:MAG: OB-fold nucleic acid binding domain-containing protein, partial [bacterium]|nr:OB-fold nucleic acid binding domain-containing protein [bacterium]